MSRDDIQFYVACVFVVLGVVIWCWFMDASLSVLLGPGS